MLKTVFVVLAVMSIPLLPGAAYAQDGKSEHASGEDTRLVIRLTAEERHAVRKEMRGFLQSIQQVTSALAAGNMSRAAAGARKSGRGAGKHMPRTLRAKLPMGFKRIGRNTHDRFDQLALDAEEMGDGEHALAQLGKLLGNCVACHATYRFEVE